MHLCCLWCSLSTGSRDSAHLNWAWVGPAPQPLTATHTHQHRRILPTSSASLLCNASSHRQGAIMFCVVGISFRAKGIKIMCRTSDSLGGGRSAHIHAGVFWFIPNQCHSTDLRASADISQWQHHALGESNKEFHTVLFVIHIDCEATPVPQNPKLTRICSFTLCSFRQIFTSHVQALLRLACAVNLLPPKFSSTRGWTTSAGNSMVSFNLLVKATTSPTNQVQYS